MRDVQIIPYSTDLSFSELLKDIEILTPSKGKHYPTDPETGKKIRYLNIICAFDIETSKAQFDGDTLGDYQSWMYLWCFQLGNRAAITGRTWMDFASFMVMLESFLMEKDAKMLCYVHHLAYEFQYLSGVFPFTEKEVFATGVREPLKCSMMSVEFRCSHRLSNYALADWARIMGTDHQKSQIDHEVVRYPWTNLGDEIKYCVTDCTCVIECIEKLLTIYGDNLYTIPYTQIGYIRRRCKRAMRVWSVQALESLQNDLKTYDRLRQCFRGGDTYLNSVYCGALLENVYSYDISSSYPAVMISCKFPMSRFKEESAKSIDDIISLVARGRAVISLLAFKNICLKKRKEACAYIPYSQCCRDGLRIPEKCSVDFNGRVTSAEYLEIACTDIDVELICDQYVWDSVTIVWSMSARYGYLPPPLTDTIKYLYREKEKLSVNGKKQLEYIHLKSELNSIYGMMAQKMIYENAIYKDNHWEIASIDREAEYKKSISKAWLNYAWGVWVTSWGRYRLYEMIQTAQAESDFDFIYADTDSVKCRRKIDFSAFNAARVEESEKLDAIAIDDDGECHYMGTIDCDGIYSAFKALKQKCYCRVENGELIITAAGIPKRESSEILSANGGIQAFDTDFVFKDKIKGASIWQDGSAFTVEIDGHNLRISKNVVVLKIGIALNHDRSYMEFVQGLKEIVDRYDHPEYN